MKLFEEVQYNVAITQDAGSRPRMNIYIVCDQSSAEDVLNYLTIREPEMMKNGPFRVGVLKESESGTQETSFIETSDQKIHTTKREKPSRGRGKKYIFTREDLKIIMDNSLTVKEMVRRTGINQSCIQSKRNELIRQGVLDRKIKPYSPEEIEILMDKGLSNRQCADLIGRPYNSVYAKRRSLFKNAKK